ETFLIDQRTIGHPRNPDFLLQHGELRAAFAPWELLLYEEGLFPTPNPAYLARMIARRRREDWVFTCAVTSPGGLILSACCWVGCCGRFAGAAGGVAAARASPPARHGRNSVMT